MAPRTPVTFAVLMLVCCLIPGLAAEEVPTTPEKGGPTPADLRVAQWIQIVLVAIMAGGVGGVVVGIFVRNTDITRRPIQLVAVMLLIPLVGILALQARLSGEATGTLLGTLTGYLLSGIGQEGPPQQPDRATGSTASAGTGPEGQPVQPTTGPRV